MNTNIVTITGAVASIALGGTALGGLNGLHYDLIGGDLVEGTWTVRLYAQVDAGDRLYAIYGNADTEFRITMHNGALLYQNTLGGPTSQSINSAFFPLVPSLEWDSYVTIGALYSDGTPFDNNALEDSGIDWDGFEAGGDVSSSNGTWFVDPSDAQGENQNGRVLIAQFTIYGGCMQFSAGFQGKDDSGVTWNSESSIQIPWDPDCPATDEDGDGVFDNIDNCYLYNPDQADCNENGVGDVCDVADGTSYDCDQNGEPDECQPDCDGDGWIDPCDSEGDIDGDGIPDNCEDDCNDNGIPDETELEYGWVTDCDGNGIPDDCDVTTDPSLDCNANGIHDACDIADGAEEDCDGNAIPDSCQMANDSSLDCDGNGILDSCEIENDQSLDCNGNGTLDECDLGGQGPEGAVQWAVEEGGNGHWYQIAIANGDCFDEIRLAALSQFGDLAVIESLEENQFITALLIPDGDYWIGLTQNLESPQYSEPGGGWEWIDGTALVYENWDSDEPNNGGPIGEDACGIFYDGTWYDMESCDFEGDQYAVIEWDAGFFSLDCNANDIPDECDIADGTSNDVNDNGIPDECEDDCNANGDPDHWDIKTETSEDCNANGIPDECDIADGTSNDVNSNSIPDECEEDCNGNGTPDDWDIKTGLSEDCNANGVPDECDLANFATATATFTLGDTEFDDTNNETITLIDTAGLSRTYVCKNDYLASGPLEWNAGATATVSATNFKAVVEASGGHNGTISVDVVAGEVTLTQTVVGDAGNTTIAHSSGWDALCDVNPPSAFSGGTHGDVDCNTNGIPDECDIADETSEDINSDGVPDECQCLADIDGSGAVTIDDILAVVGYWGSSIPAGDLNYDGIVDIEDLLIVLGAWGPCP